MIGQARTYLDKAATRLYVDAHLLSARVKERIGSVLRNDRGGVSLEWVALGFLVLAVFFAIVEAVKKNKDFGNGIADAIKNALTQVFQSITTEEK